MSDAGAGLARKRRLYNTAHRYHARKKQKLPEIEVDEDEESDESSLDEEEEKTRKTTSNFQETS